MRPRMTQPPPTGPDGDNPDPDLKSGNTTMVQGETRHRVPRSPQERDESADGLARTEPSNRRVGARAQADTERGVVDTTQGAELDATYDKLRGDLPGARKKRRP